MSRPVKELDWNIVEKRMEAGENAMTIAIRHNVSLDSFYKKFKKHYGMPFHEMIHKMKSVGKSNILFTQYAKALSGNIRMLELLGREWCGQGKMEATQSPFEDIIALRHENMMLKAEIEKNKKDLYADQPQAEPELFRSESSF